MSEIPVVTRLMRDHPDDSFTYERYRAEGGYSALDKVVTGLSPEETVELVQASGLRGRGGAGFPTGDKWAFMPDGVFPRYVVVNDDEGEPCTFKDRELTEADPHAIVEGALIAAYAVKAEAAYIYLRGEFALGGRRLERAIQDAEAAGFAGDHIAGSDFSCPVFIHAGAGAYICGEETALLESLEGFRGQPRLRPPFFPAAKGLYSQPTALNNAETLASLPHIVNRGSDWFRSMGTEKSPGPKIFSVSGTVERPGNYEFPLGVPLAELLEAAGGIRDGGSFKAVIPGGASAPWLNTIDITMDFEALADASTMLGSGSVIFMDDRTCMVDAARVSTRFFSHESCGKCTPCREGTWWTARILDRIEFGQGTPKDLDVLVEVCDSMSDPGPSYRPMGRSFCALGDGAAWSLRSAVELFRDEFIEHIEGSGCPFEKQVPAA